MITAAHIRDSAAVVTLLGLIGYGAARIVIGAARTAAALVRAAVDAIAPDAPAEEAGAEQ